MRKKTSKKNKITKGGSPNGADGSTSVRSSLTPLTQALLTIKSSDEMSNFFEDLCTPNEWKSICDRWLVAQLIRQGVSYRKIYDLTGVSTATITRVGRSLTEGSGYEALLAKLDENSGTDI